MTITKNAATLHVERADPVGVEKTHDLREVMCCIQRGTRIITTKDEDEYPAPRRAAA